MVGGVTANFLVVFVLGVCRCCQAGVSSLTGGLDVVEVVVVGGGDSRNDLGRTSIEDEWWTSRKTVGGAGKFSSDTGGGAMFLGKEVKGASRGVGVVSSSRVGGGREGGGSSTGKNFLLSSSIFDFRCFPSRTRGVVTSSSVVGGTSLKNGSSTSCRADALRAEWKFSMSLMN